MTAGISKGPDTSVFLAFWVFRSLFQYATVLLSMEAAMDTTATHGMGYRNERMCKRSTVRN